MQNNTTCSQRSCSSRPRILTLPSSESCTLEEAIAPYRAGCWTSGKLIGSFPLGIHLQSPMGLDQQHPRVPLPHGRFSFYDHADEYGFDRTAPSGKIAAGAVHVWLGALCDEKKLQLSTAPVIRGVTYQRHPAEPAFSIRARRRSSRASSCSGPASSATKVESGPLSKHQYLNDLSGLRGALPRSRTIASLLVRSSGVPREISPRAQKRADVVIFIDGFTLDGPDRVGAVMFDRRAVAPKQGLPRARLLV